MRFSITNENGNARSCIMETQRGAIHTPAFMPVATIGAVKAISTDELIEMGAKIFSVIPITCI